MDTMADWFLHGIHPSPLRRRFNRSQRLVACGPDYYSVGPLTRTASPEERPSDVSGSAAGKDAAAQTAND